MYKKVTNFIHDIYGENYVPLHSPFFGGNEKKYLNNCIDTTFVSSVGEYVTRFEDDIAKITGATKAVATMNGTAALHMALIVADVKSDDEVITQALTFVATANAISYVGAHPIFVDVNLSTLGMCPIDLEEFLVKNCEVRNDGFTYNKRTGRRVKACIPMHTFGHPVQLDEIISIAKKYNLVVIEDGAESLGSNYKGKSTISCADIGITSFNGNKIVTSGGGGAILFRDENLAQRAKHLTTTAKKNHQWEFFHTEIGYNYRMPNINAALICAQLEQLDSFLIFKRQLASEYASFFKNEGIDFILEPSECESNYWLNAVRLESLEQRNDFLEYTNKNGVMTRPVWSLMTTLPAFKNCFHTELKNSIELEKTIVNIPSSFKKRESQCR